LDKDKLLALSKKRILDLIEAVGTINILNNACMEIEVKLFGF
jgi:hypothetical protein